MLAPNLVDLKGKPFERGGAKTKGLSRWQRYDSLAARDHALSDNLLECVVIYKGGFILRSIFRRWGWGRHGSQSPIGKGNLQLCKIQVLREEFIKIGYVPEEVDYLIANYSQGENLSKLDPARLKAVEDLLEEHLDIARQSIKYVNNIRY